MNHQYQFTSEEVKVLSTQETVENKTRINRLIPSPYSSAYDPIILMDEYFIAPPSEFVTRENRKIEVVNYLYDGGIDHKNQINTQYTTILEGEVLRYTSGNGFIHSERPVGRGVNHGVQLWFALPEDVRDIDPGYQVCHEKDFHIDENKFRYIKTIAGENSPLKLNNDVEIKDVLLYEKSKIQFEIKDGHHGFIYVISGINGELITSDSKIRSSEALYFENVKTIEVENRNWATRFLFVSVKPLKEKLPTVSEVS